MFNDSSPSGGAPSDPPDDSKPRRKYRIHQDETSRKIADQRRCATRLGITWDQWERLPYETRRAHQKAEHSRIGLIAAKAKAAKRAEREAAEKALAAAKEKLVAELVPTPPPTAIHGRVDTFTHGSTLPAVRILAEIRGLLITQNNLLRELINA